MRSKIPRAMLPSHTDVGSCSVCSIACPAVLVTWEDRAGYPSYGVAVVWTKVLAPAAMPTLAISGVTQWMGDLFLFVFDLLPLEFGSSNKSMGHKKRKCIASTVAYRSNSWLLARSSGSHYGSSSGRGCSSSTQAPCVWPCVQKQTAQTIGWCTHVESQLSLPALGWLSLGSNCNLGNESVDGQPLTLSPFLLVKSVFKTVFLSKCNKENHNSMALK